MEENRPTPTLYERLGGAEPLTKLTRAFYEKVMKDDLLRPALKHMHADHPERVADFLGEVFGGPPSYSQAFGGHRHMLTQHLNLNLAEAHRRRWI